MASVSVLDPVDLRILAEAMRDETWLDLRVVEHGTVERARVTAIIVRRDGEEVELTQEMSFDGEVSTTLLNVPHDSVRWCCPTNFALEDVEIRRPAVSEDIEDGPVISAVKDLLVFFFKNHKTSPLGSRKAVEKMLAGSAYESQWVHHRHVFVWLIWRFHSGKMSPAAICSLAGYKSQMPWQSAKWKFSREEHKVERESYDKAMLARGFSPQRGDDL